MIATMCCLLLSIFHLPVLLHGYASKLEVNEIWVYFHWVWVGIALLPECCKPLNCGILARDFCMSVNDLCYHTS